VVAAWSFVTGYLGSAVGLVLGTLRLPVVLLFSASPSTAAGTNILVSAAAATTGAARHLRAGRVDWRIVAWMLPPSIAGALVGGLFGHLVPERALLGSVAAVLAWNAIDLLVRPVRGRARARPRVWPASGFGFLIGVVGGALGVILGTLRMPALLGPVGLDAKRAIGTNLVVGAFVGVVGFAAHATRLEVEWRLLAAALPAGIAGAWLGARVAGRISEQTLRRGLGVALLVVAVVFAVDAAT
jgi:uncharacterized membrane protein YfcA